MDVRVRIEFVGVEASLMTPRLNPYAVSMQSMEPMIALDRSVNESGLEKSLVELVKTRASQINGCAYCLHMHTGDALEAGETPERLLLLDAWAESPLYSARERAALAWTDALTLVAQTHAPDEVYERVAEYFSAEERVKLTMLVAAINAWNRIAIGFRSVHPAGKARS